MSGLNGFVVVIVFIVLDVVTGVMKACIKEGFNSTTIRQGLYHKGAEIAAGVLAYLLDYAALTYKLNISIKIFNLYVPYIILMETVSIIENISIISPRTAAFFAPILQKIKNKESDENETRD